ncbi:MAG: HU family DNA-binding protein [Puniceicoccales bacterium]|jgi:DNA-binding protein HU-beta|nr:HU family DNA-binding protein [Puniceicoccales bacterium]
MNKAQLVVEIQKHLGNEATRSCAEKALEGVLKAFKVSLSKDKAVHLVGFGTFSVVSRKARRGVNPQTKKAIQIPASKTIKFKPSTQLKSVCR